MNDANYIGMDVHTATISAAVRDSNGNLVMEATPPRSNHLLSQISGIERLNRPKELYR
jgi:hypothetical protein